jgi:hypothetical protein
MESLGWLMNQLKAETEKQERDCAEEIFVGFPFVEDYSHEELYCLYRLHGSSLKSVISDSVSVSSSAV